MRGLCLDFVGVGFGFAFAFAFCENNESVGEG